MILGVDHFRALSAMREDDDLEARVEAKTYDLPIRNGVIRRSTFLTFTLAKEAFRPAGQNEWAAFSSDHLQAALRECFAYARYKIDPVISRWDSGPWQCLRVELTTQSQEALDKIEPPEREAILKELAQNGVSCMRSRSAKRVLTFY